MSIQPGVGYTFTSSNLGTNLNIEPGWSEWSPGSNGPCPFDIYGLTYRESKYYVKIFPGMVNSLVVKSDDGALLTANPPPEIEVLVGASPTVAGVSFIYIRCGNTPPAGPTPAKFPAVSGEGYPMIKVHAEQDRVDDNDYGYILIGRVERYQELIPGSDPAAYVWREKINKMIGCNSLWAERFKCGSATATYWWSAV
jgi:hypothetical protein